MPRIVKPSRFEMPTAAKVVVWTIVGLVGIWILTVVVVTVFFPSMFR